MKKFETSNKAELKYEESKVSKHPVWNVLNKEKYVDEFIPKAEGMYDFIKSIVDICGNTTVGGNTVPTMQVFYNMWNEYSTETFRILGSLVNPQDTDSNSLLDALTKTGDAESDNILLSEDTIKDYVMSRLCDLGQPMPLGIYHLMKVCSILAIRDETGKVTVIKVRPGYEGFIKTESFYVLPKHLLTSSLEYEEQIEKINSLGIVGSFVILDMADC